MNGRLATLLLGLVIVATTFVSFGARAAVPTDGAYLDSQKPTVLADGLLVDVFTPDSTGLRDGDVVLAVNGRSIEQYAGALLAPAGLPDWWRLGGTVTHIVRRDGARLDVPVTLRAYPLAAAFARYWGVIASGVLAFLVGAFVFWRRPDDPAARLLFVFLTSVMSASASSAGMLVSDFVSGWGLWLFRILQVVPIFGFLIGWLCLALRFPQAHPQLVRHPTAVRVAAFVPAALWLPGTALQWLSAETALGWVRAQSELLLAVFVPYGLLIVAASVSNFRLATADPIALSKAKWLALALSLLLVTMLLWALPQAAGGAPFVPEPVFWAAGLVVPVAMAIAILRHNLFDVDLLFNRALVYGSLGATLALTYWASVVVIQRLLRLVGGELSDLAIVISTLGIAALLNPLRQRLQGLVDRRFDRRRYDAAKTLAAFSATVRDEVELERLTARLASVVEETMQAQHVSVWLRAAAGKQP